MSRLMIAGGPEASSAEGAFEQLMSGETKQNMSFGDVMNTSGVMVTATEREDVRAHGFPSCEIAILTWYMHTARAPPVSSSEFRYGVDPSSVRKLYSGLQSSVGTLLWELVNASEAFRRL